MNIIKARIYLPVFVIGAAGYPVIEILFRGRTHWTMSAAGGICFLIVYLININFNNVFSKWLLSSVAITLVEFDIGMIVNYYFGLNVWDYSYQPFNIFGQICPRYSFYWLALSLPLIYLCDLLKKKLC